MLKYKLLLFFLCFFNSTTGQTIISVFDHINQIALSNVHAKNLDDNTVQISNNKGEIRLLKSGLYKISCIGYISKIIRVNKEKHIVVELIWDYTKLNEIIISSYQIPKKLKKATTTINVLSKEDIQRGNSVNFSTILNRVPGIYMHNGALNTNRITIRGVGSRNLFGTSKIRAYYGEIPLTTGNGMTTIEDFELNSISRFEILKGNSSIYGAGLGGVIRLTPEKPYIDNLNLKSEMLIGSFGLMKKSFNLNYGSLKNSYKAIYSNTHSDGYRDNNEYDRETLSLVTNHYLNKKNTLSFIFSTLQLKAFIPSSLNQIDYETNPSAAAFTWAQSKGFEDTKRSVLGGSWSHKYNNSVEQVSSVFASLNKSYEPRPFNILKENTFAYGIRTRVNAQKSLFDRKLNWTLGGELFRDIYKYKTFENLYQDFPQGTGSVQGNKILDSKETRSYYNLFFETNYNITEKTMLLLGLNYNNSRYNINQTGIYKFKGILSPKIGVSQLLSENTTLYSNISHGFSPISTEEILLPNGEINLEIKPETGWNFEIGTRGEIFNKKLNYNLAIYQLNIRNLLVTRRTAEGEFFGVNAGKTQHNGMELALNYRWVDKSHITIQSFLSFSLNDYVFKDFIDNNEDFSGNDLTGVPSEVFNVGFDISTNLGVYGNLNFQHVGRIPITDSNSLYSSDYNLTNIKIGYKANIAKIFKLNMFFGVQNLFKIKYASQILINAQGFNGSIPRYYYPGNPINTYLGVNINIVVN